MTASPFDSALFGPLIGDAEVAALFTDEATIAAMIVVERALARAQARCGVIPAEAAREIDTRLAGTRIEPTALATGTASAGVPVPVLVAALREGLGPDGGHFLHWGATSQDIVDTGLALRLDRALACIGERLAGLLDGLEASARHWRDLPMAGRTRSQIAAPISFGLRIAGWAAPLIELEHELGALRPRIAQVQLGGAVGANSVIAPHGAAVVAVLAQELGLAPAPAWHANRVRLAALAGWCASVAGALGKLAGDLIVMGRSEIAEAQAGAGGGSSTMPQKANPVLAETVVALARFVAGLTGPMQLATLHHEERDGAAWMLEWLALPQCVLAAATCLRHGRTLVGSLAPDAERMAAHLGQSGGAAMAEQASFLLSAHRPRAEAQSIVKAAVAEQELSLAEALATRAPVGIDWAVALDPASTLFAADAAIDGIFRTRRTSA